MSIFSRFCTVAALCAPSLLRGQEPDSAAIARARAMPPITLAPDDKRAVPDAPAGFNVARAGVPHGTMEMIEYDSKTVGTRRKMLVYTPPGYTSAKRYP